MTEEPRRSGRATKGQHTKNFDIDEIPTRKTASKSKARKQAHKEQTPEEEEEGAGEEIRCVCGINEEDEDDEGRKFICCEECGAWQHNDCMEITEDEDNLPEKYYCEQCHPQDHQDLLDKIKRGEKPWEETARLRKEKRKTHRKKGGRRSKKARQSDAKSEATSEEIHRGRSTTSAHDRNGEASGAQNGRAASKNTGGQKRKQSEPAAVSQEPEQPKPKVRRVSSQHATPSKLAEKAAQHKSSKTPSKAPAKPMAPALSTPQAKDGLSQIELVNSPDELQHESRKKAAVPLINLFIQATTNAQKEGAFSLPEGATAASIGQRLGLVVEWSMYMNHCNGTGPPSRSYSDQLRTILYNVKRNPVLRNRLLSGNLTPDAISMMKSEDMASEELQQQIAETKKEMEKQHVLVKEDGPRIRRTHKGEELVGDAGDSQLSGAETNYNIPEPARHNADTTTSAPSATSPHSSPRGSPKVELPESSMFGGPRGPLSIDTKNAPQTTGHRKSSTANFNIQDVWSSVHSPDHDRQRQQQPASAGPTTQTRNVQADAEIDRLLAKEDIDMESPPYSPVDYSSNPDIVWHGKITLNGVEFQSSAKHVAGGDISSRIPWSRVIPETLHVDGRIGLEQANAYLCGLRYSKSQDLSVLAISPPENPQARRCFDTLSKYFTDRKRYGVVSTNSDPAVVDTYIVPLAAGSDQKPDFMDLLIDMYLDDPRPEPLLLIILITKIPFARNMPVNHDITENNQIVNTATTGPAAPQAYGIAPHLPLSTAPAMANQTAAASPVSMTSVPSGPHFASPVTPITPMQNAYHQPPYPSQAQQSQGMAVPQSAPKGAQAATIVLGQLAQSPAIQELLLQTPGLGINEFTLLKSVVESEPNTLNDYGLLLQTLQSRAQANNPPAAAPGA
ncbi:MAG: hypothetical protein M1834_001710 [Cirrosporium novae-zelandiae]|nr:MAG: hypothetical protein M1834_001710 [Cirrosporium novae-zelandiae]